MACLSPRGILVPAGIVIAFGSAPTFSCSCASDRAGAGLAVAGSVGFPGAAGLVWQQQIAVTSKTVHTARITERITPLQKMPKAEDYAENSSNKLAASFEPSDPASGLFIDPIF